MNKFNLTFWGEILPGREPATVKARFARLFDIQDPERLEHFFSGETVTLRRNLERKVAAEYFAKLHKLGVEAELVKVDTAGATAKHPREPVTTDTEPESGDEWEQARRQAEIEVIRRAQQDSEARKREAEERRRLAEARAEEERQFRERQAALERERQEQLARRQAEKQEQQRRREAEAQRQREEQEERRRRREEEDARRLAEREAQRRRKAEAAALKKAEAAAEAELRRAEEAARLQEEKEQQQRLQAEEALRKQERQAERDRRRAQREARLREVREEQRRQKAEAATRRRAEAKAAADQRKREQEQRRREREQEITRKKAERESARLAAEAEAARRHEEGEARKRQQAEEAARQRAQREAERREKVEADERRRAELAAAREAAERELARKKAEAAERQRLRRETASQEAALRARELQQATEQAARERAQADAERKRQEQARQRKLAEEKAQRDAEDAREREQLAARQREEDARRRAEREAQARKRQEEKVAREQARAAQKAERQAQREAEIALEQARAEERKRLEEQAMTRGAAALSHKPGLKRSPARVKSSLDLPRREKPGQGPARRRQPGAPNDYKTRPFRNTAEVRNRPELAAQKLRQGLGIATLVLAISFLLVGRYLGSEPVEVYSGPDRIAAIPGGQLLIQAGDKLLLHDRAGVGKTTIEAGQLRLAAVTGPMAFTEDRQLLLRGVAADDPSGTARLRRCDLAARTCESFAKAAPGAGAALAVHPLTGHVFFADPVSASLHKLDSDGGELAQADLSLAPRPAMILDSGLLFLNSHEGPAISVRRYEDQAFGQQLDEILVLPPAALEAGQVQVHDFLKAGDRWWVSMINPDNNSAGLYLFDGQWKYLDRVALPATHLPALLTGWGSKVLVSRPETSRILRFNAAGAPEVDLQSDLLSGLIESQQRRQSLTALGWAAGFSLCLVAVALTLAFTYIHYLRNLVYRGRATRGAEPLDQFSGSLDWADPLPDRGKRLRRTAIRYGLFSLSVVLLLVGLGASVWQLAATMVALAGPATGLYLYQRGTTGHAGVTGDTLALVDHRDIYHLASDARIQYREPFLLIDDVVVFTGTASLPALAPDHVQEKLRPVYLAGARVDRKTVLVKLLESRHPLALSALACALCALGAAVLLLAGSF